MNPTDELPQALFETLTEAEVRCLIEDMGQLTGAHAAVSDFGVIED